MVLVFFGFWTNLAVIHAEPSYAISRFGKPKYGPDFKALDYVNPQAPKGGALKMSAVGTFDSLNEFAVKGTAPVGIMLMLADPLMKRPVDDPFTWYGVIAEKADLAKDASTLTIYINPKARFHDKTPITAEDVKFSIELLRDHGLPRYRHHYSRIQEITIIDPLTIKFTFKKEDGKFDPELPILIAIVRVLSKKDLEGKDFKETGLTALLGSGPYRVGKVDPGRSITYERVPDYWAADLPINRGQYNFDTIKIDYYKTAQAQFEAFKVGEFDCFFEADQKQWNTAYTFNAIKDGRVKLASFPHNRPVTVRTIIFNMQRPIFQDIRLRKALSLAFDFDTMSKMLFHNGYQRMTSLFDNTHLAHKGPASLAERALLEPYKDNIDPEILETGYVPPVTKGDGNQRENLSKADQLLNEAGWVIKNGKRTNTKTGEVLNLEFMLKDPRLEKVALSFKKSLANLGVTLNVRLMDTNQHEARVVDRDFDMIAHAWTNSLSPGNEQTYYFGVKTADQKGSSNYIGLKDPVAESLAHNVAFATSSEVLTEAVHALDRYVLCQHYMIPVFYDNTTSWAYWKDRLDFPPFDPKVGTNAMEWWWASGVRNQAPQQVRGDNQRGTA